MVGQLHDKAVVKGQRDGTGPHWPVQKMQHEIINRTVNELEEFIRQLRVIIACKMKEAYTTTGEYCMKAKGELLNKVRLSEVDDLRLRKITITLV